ncbi:histidinol-phosphate transaminase [Aliidiomarina haloalkalitolerans]|uniref:Histidinol-phosphate aminotransferase n=1 Tax=Aliidiomarina haloalkalitolerans TaxID=859059 RepID=A0A432VXB9_9GAMM|nr:histidinol-phosphate transaminase [Aliidiomarina haloalkalitolerans]RUO21340.1 histidinol-phosphate transaminase [Aliidiomarina haloalkalitolerans]
MSTAVANLVNTLMREHLRLFTPYASARRSMSGGSVWLNANESPYSQTYSVKTEGLNRYPDFQNQALNQAYADYAGVAAKQVISHRGSDESIELLIRTFCEPGRDKILICPPTYGMYAISAAINNNETVAVPLLADTWQLDLDGIEQALNNEPGIKVVFLCNPSNPLGNALQRDSMQRVIELCQNRALVVIDEAYIEFAQARSPAAYANSNTLQGNSNVSMVAAIDQNPHVIVMRTLSKAFGLAGIRVGFTLTNADLVQALLPVLAPYPLPDLSIQVAQQALSSQEQARVQTNTAQTIAERAKLALALQGYPWVKRVHNSVTNFILVSVNDADALMQHCIQAGVLIRNQSSQVGLSNCVRITVGSASENQQLLAVLDDFKASKAGA